MLLKDKIGFLGTDNRKTIENDEHYSAVTKLTNPLDHNTLDDKKYNSFDYTPDYLTNYYNPFSFSAVPQDTYLTTVTPRVQRSFIPLRDTEWRDSYVDESQIEPRVHKKDIYSRHDPFDDKYDYVMSREDFETMLRNNHYQYQYSQPKTYQNMMMS